MAGELTISQLNGLVKEVYGDSISKVVPDQTKMQKLIPFVAKQKESGGTFHIPVLLAYEQGFTYLAAGAGVTTLNDQSAGVMKDAQVLAPQIYLRSQLDFEAAARAAKGRNAFQDATALMFESMAKSTRRRVEMELFHGQQGLGTVASISTNTITVTTSEWAPGNWAGSEGAVIQIYNSSLSTSRGTATIVSVDLDARTITVDSAPGGVSANDVIYWKGQVTAGGTPAYAGMVGLHKALSTSSGSLFNISTATYNLWRATSYAAGSAALTFQKIQDALARAYVRGLDEDCVLFVNPRAFGNLVTDQAALVRHKSGEIKNQVMNGSKSIEFYALNGKVTIEPSPYVKEGYAYGICADAWKRVGASDVSFNVPGQGDQVFFVTPTANAVEARCYVNMALMPESLAKNFIITGIVNA